MRNVLDVIANRDLHWVGEDWSVAEAAKAMAEAHCGAILVLDKGELRGLFSERDLMLRVVLERRDPENTLVKNVMTTQLATIDASAPIADAMEAMRSRNCRHLPVLSEGRVVAMLSMRDLMNFELAQKTEELHHMRAFIQTNA